MRTSRLSNSLIALGFCGLLALLLLSNGFDWDYVFTTAEVDRRAWLLDHQLPLWSYQLCGGVTRAGDAQAFGLSPTFLPVILLGSFWGPKVAALLFAGMGFWFLSKLLELIVKDRISARALSACFVFSNFFLWHFNLGHYVFTMNYLALGILYYFFKAACTTDYSKKDAGITFVLVASYFLGGFYHSTLFFLLPATLGAMFACGIGLVFGWRPVDWRGLGRYATASFLGITSASYRIYLAYSYQLSNAKQPVLPMPDSSLVGKTAQFLALPTWGLEPGYAWLPDFGPYGVWEYSVFNLAAWVCVGALILLLFKVFKSERPRQDPNDKLWALFIAALILTEVSCVYESESPLSLHFWINRLLLDGSSSVIGRYQLVLSLACTCLAALLLGRYPKLKSVFQKWIFVPLLVLLNLNFLTFQSALSWDSVKRVASYSSQDSREMTRVAIAPTNEDGESLMYEPTLQGWAVLNCYNTISREIHMTGRFEGRRELMNPETGHLRERTIYSWIDDRGSPLPERCLAETSFSQNHLKISPECPRGTCFNLNGLNPAEAPLLKTDQNSGKYCL